MVAPTAFGFNEQTAQDNSFMHASREGGSTDAGSDVTHHVLREFAGLYRELTEVKMVPEQQHLSNIKPTFAPVYASIQRMYLLPGSPFKPQS